MSKTRFRTGVQERRLRRGLATAATLVLASVGLSACQGDQGAAADPTQGDPTPAATPSAAPVRIHANVRRNAVDVPVDRTVRLSASGASLDSVRVDSPLGELEGTLADDTWTASGRLEPGTAYVVHATATAPDGQRATRTSKFRTQALTLDQQTYASVAPLEGETVGVGMPVIVTFDVPVTDRASIEKHMSVAATPRQPGSWHWISDTEVHWRPKSYWKAGTDVSVNVDINSVPAGAGIFGQESRHIDFQVGDANIYKVNAQTDMMQVFQNGNLLRTLPITTGKPGFVTRSGVKVIIEKFRHKRMNSETVGIPADSAEAYDINDVEYAMRVTYSGEFLHAAPWSVSSQGHSNVSHGCTGLSTSNAAWLYNISKRGDVVEYTGTDRQMTLTNGYGDWNDTFAEYRAGSALS